MARNGGPHISLTWWYFLSLFSLRLVLTTWIEELVAPICGSALSDVFLVANGLRDAILVGEHLSQCGVQLNANIFSILRENDCLRLCNKWDYEELGKCVGVQSSSPAVHFVLGPSPFNKSLVPVGTQKVDTSCQDDPGTAILEYLFPNQSTTITHPVYLATSAPAPGGVGEGSRKGFEALGSWRELYRLKHKIFSQKSRHGIFQGGGGFGHRKDFQGIPITATVAKFATTVAPFTVKNGTIHLEVGFGSYVFFGLQEMFNFTIRVIEGGFYRVNPTLNTSEGLDTLDQLISGRSDIYIMIPTMVPYRAMSLHFLHPYTSLGDIKIIFRQPPNYEIRNIYYLPFRFRVWICYIFAAITIYFTIRLISIIRRVWHCSLDADSEFSQETFMWIVGMILQQALEVFPGSVPLRVVFIAGTMASYLIFNAYSGGITATLFNEGVPIGNLDALMRSRIRILADAKSSSMSHIFNELKQAYGRGGSWVTDITTALRAVWRGNHAFISPMSGPDMFLRLDVPHEDICKNIYTLKVWSNSLKNGMMVSRTSQLRDFFNFGIIRQIESGQINRYLRTMFEQGSVRCIPLRSYSREDLGLRDLFTPFGILILLIILSLVLLLLEKLYHGRQRRISW